jgi:hypothetical protein
MRRLSFVTYLLLSSVAWGKEPAAIQFIDKSYIEVPKTAGLFTLIGTSYESKTFYSGVTTKWKAPEATPSLRVDVFVYPKGRADEAAAAAGSMDEVEAALAEAAKQGLYSNVKKGTRTPFVIVRPDSAVMDGGKKKSKAAFDPTPKPETMAVVSGDSKDPMLKVFTESMASPNSHGLRLTISFDRDGGTWRSAAFVFYRNLFLFKVRISAPVEEMTDEAFESLAVSTAREVVPRIQVTNFGTCGNITISEPAKGTNKDKATQDTGEQLIRGLARVADENCASSPGKKDEVPAEYERVVIEYPAGTWKAGD